MRNNGLNPSSGFVYESMSSFGFSQFLRSLRLSENNATTAFNLCVIDKDYELHTSFYDDIIDKYYIKLHIVKDVTLYELSKSIDWANLICSATVSSNNNNPFGATLYLDPSIHVLKHVLNLGDSSLFSCIPHRKWDSNFCDTSIIILPNKFGHLLLNTIFAYIDNTKMDKLSSHSNQMSLTAPELINHFIRSNQIPFRFLSEHILLRSSVHWLGSQNSALAMKFDTIDTNNTIEYFDCDKERTPSNCQPQMKCTCKIHIIPPYHMLTLTAIDQEINRIYANQTTCRLLAGCDDKLIPNLLPPSTQPPSPTSSSTQYETSPVLQNSNRNICDNNNMCEISKPSDNTNEAITVNKPKVISVFPYFDELHLLQLKLQLQRDSVDKFVIIEARQTFTGLRKPPQLLLSRQLHTLPKDLLASGKVVHIEIHLPHVAPGNEGDREEEGTDMGTAIALTREQAWENERTPRNYLSKILELPPSHPHYLNVTAEDIILVTDLDEIVKPTAISRLLSIFSALPQPQKTYMRLSMPFFVYNLSSPMGDFLTTQPYAINVGYIQRQFHGSSLWTTFPSSIRVFEYEPDLGRSLTFSHTLARAGWHLSNFKSIERIERKLESYAHIEFNKPDVKKSVHKRVKQGRPVEFLVDEESLAYNSGNVFLQQRVRSLDDRELEDPEFLYLRSLWERLATAEDAPVAPVGAGGTSVGGAGQEANKKGTDTMADDELSTLQESEDLLSKKMKKKKSHKKSRKKNSV